MESAQKSKYIKKIDDAGLKREDVINLSHAEIVVELGKLGLDQHGRKLTHAKKAVLENQISLGGKYGHQNCLLPSFCWCHTFRMGFLFSRWN